MRSIYLHFLTPEGSEATPKQMRLSVLNMHPSSSEIQMELYDSTGPRLCHRPPERFDNEFLRNPFDKTCPDLELDLQPKAADLWNLGNSLHVLLSGEELPRDSCPPKKQHYYPSGLEVKEKKFWGRPRLNAFIKDMFPSADEHGERRFMQLFLRRYPRRVVVSATLDERYLLLVAVMVKCLHPYAPCRLCATRLFAEKTPNNASLLDLNNVSDSVSCQAFLSVISWLAEDHDLTETQAEGRRLGTKAKRENEIVLPVKAACSVRSNSDKAYALRLCDADADDSEATQENDEDEDVEEPFDSSELDEGY